MEPKYKETDVVLVDYTMGKYPELKIGVIKKVFEPTAVSAEYSYNVRMSGEFQDVSLRASQIFAKLNIEANPDYIGDGRDYPSPFKPKPSVAGTKPDVLKR